MPILSGQTPDQVTVPGGSFTTAAKATSNRDSGVIGVNLSTASGATCALTISNNQVTANSVVQASLFDAAIVNPANGAIVAANTGGDPTIGTVTPAQGSVVVNIVNRGGSAFNGGIKVAFVVLN